jgi:hypothetical protein
MTHSKYIRLALVTAGICVLSLANAGQKIFKWTDANGQVHYDAKPPTTVKSERVRETNGQGVAPVLAAADKTEQAAGKPAMSAEDRSKLTDYCKNVRDRMSALKSGAGRVTERAPDGSEMRLGQAEIDQKMGAERANESKYCTANGI